MKLVPIKSNIGKIKRMDSVITFFMKHTTILKYSVKVRTHNKIIQMVRPGFPQDQKLIEDTNNNHNYS